MYTHANGYLTHLRVMVMQAVGEGYSQSAILWQDQILPKRIQACVQPGLTPTQQAPTFLLAHDLSSPWNTSLCLLPGLILLFGVHELGFSSQARHGFRTRFASYKLNTFGKILYQTTLQPSNL